MINIPDGRKAEVVTQVRTVVVRGHLEDLELLDQGVDVIKPPPFDLDDLLDTDDPGEAPLPGMNMG